MWYSQSRIIPQTCLILNFPVFFFLTSTGIADVVAPSTSSGTRSLQQELNRRDAAPRTALYLSETEKTEKNAVVCIFFLGFSAERKLKFSFCRYQRIASSGVVGYRLYGNGMGTAWLSFVQLHIVIESIFQDGSFFLSSGELDVFMFTQLLLGKFRV